MQKEVTIPATRVETVRDEVHGKIIEEPYRWLEDATSPETTAWVAEQNAYTRALLDDVPGRDTIQDRLAQLLSIGFVSAPVRRGNRSFYLRREGTQNQPVLWVREDDAEAERPLLDPNEMSEGGTVALDWWYPSWDGMLLAYGYSANGDEWSTLHVLDVETGRLLPDRIERARYSSVAWLPDASGFYYTRYPHAGEVPPEEMNYHARVFFHALGADPARDQLIFGQDQEPEAMIDLSIDPSGRYLLVSAAHGWGRNDLYLRDLSTEGDRWIAVAEGLDALFGAEVAGETLYIHTNLDAPRYRLLRAPVVTPTQEHWQEILPETEEKLESVTPAGGQIVAQYLHNATSQLRRYAVDGTLWGEVSLPGLGTVTEIYGQWEERSVYYGFQSFVVPPTVFELSLPDGTNTVWAETPAPIDTERFLVRQEWYESHDGTRISMFLVHPRDLDRNQPHPTLLTGYGGFNVSRTPLFTRGVYLWLESGGVYALPNLRGGGEYGEAWHRDGMLDKKQNVFDDFIAAAEYLIAERYTTPDRLAISGGSNGGLLVGAVLTQRPDLFRAVVCQVPLLDMLRYHHFLIARLWVAEYGSADDPAQFPYIHAYSPYHHVRAGAHYPAVLFMTAESDTRVDPLHARKMTALMQASSSSAHPILLRLETQAGHGAGKPLTKVLEEQVDFWTFLFWQLDVPV